MVGGEKSIINAFFFTFFSNTKRISLFFFCLQMVSSIFLSDVFHNLVVVSYPGIVQITTFIHSFPINGGVYLVVECGTAGRIH